MKKEIHQLSSDFSVSLNYYIYLPQEYDAQKSWPLILFLHGAGERGDNLSDLELVTKNGLPNYIEDHPEFPFIVICPQCPINSYWPSQVEQLNILLENIIKQYKVDDERIYLTGLSMGGYGTWYMAFSHTEKFAAIAPVCGAGIKSSAQKLASLPIWVFHGEKDPIIPFSESEYLVNAIRQCGGDIKFTAYPEVGHDSWTKTYQNKELYEWFLSHKRQKKQLV